MAEVVHTQHFPIFTLIYDTKGLLTCHAIPFIRHKQLRKTTITRFFLEAFLDVAHGNTTQKQIM